MSVNGQESERVAVTSGVPQGSVLGPTLFIYYINDLPEVTESGSKIFADDTKGFNPIKSDEDHIKQQECIDSFVEWSVKWLLGFNTGKCNMMHLGKNNPKHTYTIKNGDEICELSVTTCEKDLGVYIDPLLDFNEHISKTLKKARSVAGMILRHITGRTADILVPLFVGLVRPIIEYANPVWCPMYRKHIDLIEKVQKRFTKRICGLNNLTYEERLKKLNLPSLEFRRARGDMIETYKIIHGVYDSTTTTSLYTKNSNNTRTNTNKLFKPRCATKKYQHFFTNRIVNNWNSLPDEIVCAESLNVFKNTLDKHWGYLKFSVNFVERFQVRDNPQEEERMLVC